jgi:GTP-binding protein
MPFPQEKIRNIAIIAHVDHGKTTLVDMMFRQAGMFRDNQVVAERLMDSMDQERERGITIQAKNGSLQWNGYKINIIDTPGHADFGGQVERVLRMCDGVVLLVDAQEGPMPQTYFVLKKALALSLPVMVVINKVDKPAARPEWVHDQVFELFMKLQAPDHLLDFPVLYGSAKNGWIGDDWKTPTPDLSRLLEKIVEFFPAPPGDSAGPFQMLVSSLSYSNFLGRLAVGKITSGALKVNQDVAVAVNGTVAYTARLTKLYGFEVNRPVETPDAGTGDVVAVAGLEKINIGETLTDPLNPQPLPPIIIDPPTVSMNFVVNDSPFAGLDGQFVTSRHLRERLFREALADVALHVEDLPDTAGYKVAGRGELHLSVLIEKMRREGYEFAVTRPQVILKEENGEKTEPYEDLTVDVDETYMGAVIENLGSRKGQMTNMSTEMGMARLSYRIPTRGLLGFRSEFLTQTKGMGVMNYVFDGYGPYIGEMRNRKLGVLISQEKCVSVAFALFNLEPRGRLFMGPQVDCYAGMIIGEHSRENDLVVNPAKGKKLTNMRASGSDDAVTLTPHVKFSLEQCLTYINDDELVEVTPKNIRMRKRWLDENERRRRERSSVLAD